MVVISEDTLRKGFNVFGFHTVEAEILTKIVIYNQTHSFGITQAHLFLLLNDLTIDSFHSSIHELHKKKTVQDENGIITVNSKEIKRIAIELLSDSSNKNEEHSQRETIFSDLMKILNLEPKKSTQDTNYSNQKFKYLKIANNIANKFQLKFFIKENGSTIDLPLRKLRFRLYQLLLLPTNPPSNPQFTNIMQAIVNALSGIVGISIAELSDFDEKDGGIQEILGYFIRNFDLLVNEYLFGTAFPPKSSKIGFEIEEIDETNGISLKIIYENSFTNIHAKIFTPETHDSAFYFIWTSSADQLKMLSNLRFD